MWNTPETRSSVLVRLQDPADEEAWRIFESIYRPAIYRTVRAAGVQDADAHDIAQAILTTLSQREWQFQPDTDRGRFRSWLSVVTRNAIADHYRRNRGARTEAAMDPAKLAMHVSDSREWQSHIDLEYRREVFRWASRIVQSEFSTDAWQSFWRTAVDGISIAQAARELNRSPGAVYTSRSRIMRRLRQQVCRFDDTIEGEL